MKRKEGTELLQIEGTHTAETVNVAECLNIKYKEEQFVNIDKSHK